MSDDTIHEKLAAQDLLDSVNSAIAKLNEACVKFSDTMIALTTHESDEEAHPFIQDLIRDVVDGTGFILKTEATPLIGGMITTHNGDGTAHPATQTLITNLTTALELLKARVDVLAPEDPSDPQTELARRIKEIEDQFDPVLTSLREAWIAATIGNTGTADQIAQDYTNTAAAKATAIAAVMQEFEYA